MRQITYAFWSFTALLVGLWALAEPLRGNGFFALRGSMIQLSGVLAIGYMSVAMILAMRPHLPEQWLGGLDKMYRLHKWLGIAGFVLAVTHWLWAKAPKWALSLGLLERGTRSPRAPVDNVMEQFLRSLRGTAESLGEWALYGSVVLIIIALVRWIPYRFFYKVHRLLAAFFLVLAFHAIVLSRFSYWTTPLGLLMGALLVYGAYAAVLALLGRIGAGRRVTGHITRLHYYPELHTLEAEIDIPHGWLGHRAGQFAFVSGDPSEGPHPFTIASAWDPADRRMKFLARELGDFTRTLRDRRHVGEEVVVEGPYGCFTFDDAQPVQIWVAGGIGVTPFIARLHEIALERRSRTGQSPQKEIHLFHATSDDSAEGEAKLRADAATAGVTLHRHDEWQGRLTGDHIRAMVPRWRDASIWFCGPTGLGDTLQRDLASHGFDTERRFHRELFEMR